MESLRNQLNQAEAELNAQEEPARKVERLKVELAAEEVKDQAARNLAAMKTARAKLAEHNALMKKAQSAMDQAASVTFRCWLDMQNLAKQMPELIDAAQGRSQYPIPNPPCPLSSETRTRLML